MENLLGAFRDPLPASVLVRDEPFRLCANRILERLLWLASERNFKITLFLTQDLLELPACLLFVCAECPLLTPPFRSRIHRRIMVDPLRNSLEQLKERIQALPEVNGQHLIAVESLSPYFLQHCAREQMFHLSQLLLHTKRPSTLLVVGLHDGMNQVESINTQALLSLEDRVSQLFAVTLRLFASNRFAIDVQRRKVYAVPSPLEEHDASENILALDDHDPFTGILAYEHRKSNGSLLQEAQSFHWVYSSDSDLPDFQWIPELAVDNKTSNGKMSSKEVEESVPFNLKVTKEQAESRANVELPYMRAQQSTGDPLIIYEPEDADDFDEDDPDMDLEI